MVPEHATEGGVRLLSFDVGLKHLAYAQVFVSEEQDEPGQRKQTLERWGVIDVFADAGASAAASLQDETKKPKKKKPPAPEALTTALVEALDRHFYDDPSRRYDHVLIENQPSQKNPAMKAVQVAIHTYFATLRLYADCVGKVVLVSARRKLEGDDEHQQQHQQQPRGPPKSAGAAYRERKARSVQLCRALLQGEMNDAAALSQLDGAKKKDDLCDALLQASWFAKSIVGSGLRQSRPPRGQRGGP